MRKRWQAVRRWWWVGWIGAWLAAGYWAAPRHDWPRIAMRFSNSPAVELLGYTGYALFDVGETILNAWQHARLKYVDATPYRAYLEKIAARRPKAPDQPRPRKNVIYLQMESVDGLVIGARYRGKPLMPFLESLARQDVYFANVINNTASGRTTDGELLVLTSQVPLRSAPAFVSQPLDRVPSLPKVLKADGYWCFSIHGYHGSFWRRRAAHQALGFDDNFFQRQLEPAEEIGWGISDRAVLHQAAVRIAASRKPVFAHIILLTNHHPYDYVGRFFGRRQPTIEANYVESVRYVDDCIAAFFQELKAAGVLKNSIVAIYSDHDSAITGKLIAFLDKTPRRLMTDEVPLIVTGLQDHPEEVDGVAGLQDLPVLVLEALGLPVPLTFTGHGLHEAEWTVAARYGALRSTPHGIERFSLPVSQEILTLLALNFPEKLLEHDKTGISLRPDSGSRRGVAGTR